MPKARQAQIAHAALFARPHLPYQYTITLEQDIYRMSISRSLATRSSQDSLCGQRAVESLALLREMTSLRGRRSKSPHPHPDGGRVELVGDSGTATPRHREPRRGCGRSACGPPECHTGGCERAVGWLARRDRHKWLRPLQELVLRKETPRDPVAAVTRPPPPMRSSSPAMDRTPALQLQDGE